MFKRSGEGQKIQFKMGMRKKLVIFISLAVLATSFCGMFFAAAFSVGLIKDEIGHSCETLAENLGEYLTVFLNDEIGDLQAITTSISLREAIERSNKDMESKDPSQIDEFQSGMDRIWGLKGEGDAAIAKYIDSSVSKYLREYIKHDADIAEIIISDKFGNLVAATNKTTDFKQSDEKWWIEGYDSGRGRITLEAVRFDESVNADVVNFVFPVLNRENEVIGVMKAAADVESIFGLVNKFTLGKTGHAAIINGRGRIIYHPAFKGFSGERYRDRFLCGQESCKSSKREGHCALMEEIVLSGKTGKKRQGFPSMKANFF